jgi:hypothetical protein
MDMLVLARAGDRERLGPRSLGPDARFVVDHALRVPLIWPDIAPELMTSPVTRGPSAWLAGPLAATRRRRSN